MKAQWFVEDDVDEDLDADPFEAPIEELGIPIDLRSAPDLIARLADLLREEGELDGAGVTCSLRGRPGMVCSACPVSQAATQTPMGHLCRNARAQDVVLSTIRVVEDGSARAS